MRVNFASLSSSRQRPLSQLQSKESITLSLSYPYSISRSLSPQNYQHELQVMKETAHLPQATCKFIKSVMKDELQKRQQEKLRDKYCSRTINQSMDGQLRLDTSLDMTTVTNMSFVSTRAAEDLVASFNSSVRRTKKPQSHHINNNHKNPWRPKVKQHNCIENKTTKERHQFEEECERTHHPRLINNKYNRQLNKKHRRKDVYTNLYQDYLRHTFKKSLQREKRNQEIYTNRKAKGKYIDSKVVKTLLRNYIPFYERYQQLLQKSSEKLQRNINGHQYDWKTGEKLFNPNLNLSKATYKLYKNSLGAAKSDLVNPNKQSETVEQLIITSIGKETPPATFLAYTEKDTRSTSLNRSVELNENVQDRVIDRIADIFFSSSEKYRKGVSQLSQLNHSEFQVLYPFLTSLESHGSINRPLFTTLMKKYYQKLTLYDREILRDQTKRNNRTNALRKQRQQESVRQMTYHPTINNFSHSLSKQKDAHAQNLWYI